MSIHHALLLQSLFSILVLLTLAIVQLFPPLLLPIFIHQTAIHAPIFVISAFLCLFLKQLHTIRQIK